MNHRVGLREQKMGDKPLRENDDFDRDASTGTIIRMQDAMSNEVQPCFFVKALLSIFSGPVCFVLACLAKATSPFTQGKAQSPKPRARRVVTNVTLLTVWPL